jgi:hypothetical protein
MRTLHLMLLLATLFIGGCATTIPTLSDSKKITPEKHFAYQNPQQGNASLTVLRDRAFAGSAVDYRLLIDGILSAQISAGEFATLYIPAGERVIEIRHPSAFIGTAGDSATLRAEENMKYYYRINSDLGQMPLLRTTEASIEAK